MEEIKTPYDDDIVRRDAFRDGYRVALARDVVSIGEIRAVLDRSEMFGVPPSGVAEAIQRLQLHKPAARDVVSVEEIEDALGEHRHIPGHFNCETAKRIHALQLPKVTRERLARIIIHELYKPLADAVQSLLDGMFDDEGFCKVCEYLQDHDSVMPCGQLRDALTQLKEAE